MAIATTPTADERLAWEASSRPRGMVVAAFGALAFVLGSVLSLLMQSGAPLVGLVQALQPALQGKALPAVDPRAQELVFLHDRAGQEIASTVLTALGLIALGVILWLLYRATRNRQQQLPPALGRAVLVAPILAALVTLVLEAIFQAKLSSFISGHDRGQHAVQSVLDVRRGGAILAVAVITQLLTAAAVVWVSLQAMRVGLLTRFVGTVGIVVGVLFIFPFPLNWVIQAFWMLAVAVLLAGRWPGGQPPAWASGEAMPWPTRREVYEQREAAKNRAEARAIQDKPAASDDRPAPAAPADDAPRPVPRSQANRRKRRKKR